MPSIKSDLTNKSFAGGGLRELEVSDDSEYDSDQDQGYPDIAEMNKRMAARGLPPVDEATIRQMYAMQQSESGNDGGNRRRPAPPPQPLDELQEMERAVKASRAAKQGKPRLSDGAKKRIEVLCEMTRTKRHVNIGEVVFSLRTLKTKEMREALLTASQFDGSIESPFEIRKQLLARSLYEVAGSDIALFLSDTSLEAIFDFLDNTDETVLTKLYSEYLFLIDEANGKFAIKNEQDAKELVEDLKK